MAHSVQKVVQRCEQAKELAETEAAEGDEVEGETVARAILGKKTKYKNYSQKEDFLGHIAAKSKDNIDKEEKVVT